jgi:hypothetical protein
MAKKMKKRIEKKQAKESSTPPEIATTGARGNSKTKSRHRGFPYFYFADELSLEEANRQIQADFEASIKKTAAEL